MNSVLANIDQIRQSYSTHTTSQHKASLGQYFTPTDIAVFMASLFELKDKEQYKILDAGAGIGCLSSALLQKIQDSQPNSSCDVTAVELDKQLITTLQHNLQMFEPVKLEVCNENFIDFSFLSLLENRQSFDLIILNPPYKKINAKSKERLLLRKLGIEVVNLYAAFVALSLELLANQGELVVILPRSFCNGTYFRPFREFILERSAIKTIHTFESRQDVFQDESILQENIILHLQKGPTQNNDVCISHSTNSSFKNLKKESYPFSIIVRPDDKDKFIHIPTTTQPNNQLNHLFSSNLEELGLQVSTGPVVDFRVKEELCFDLPKDQHVPLFYPSHFDGISSLVWINPQHKKPNALRLNEQTMKMVYQAGDYCIVRRFSPKEQKHRIVAHFLDQSLLTDYSYFAFENHLNVFHIKKAGLNSEIALGLTIYLNSNIVDQYFRQFSGHTQINVGDLKKLPYPNLEQLKTLGLWAQEYKQIQQDQIDQKVMELVQNV